jgi:hypothetical protein
VLNDPEFESRQGKEICFFSKMSRRAAEPTQPSIEWVTGAGHEAEHSRPSGTEVKSEWCYTPIFLYDFMACIATN